MKREQQIAKTMEKAELKGFGKPDEVREFPNGRLELIKLGGATIGRAVFEPGWRWSTSLQPLARTESCEAPHFQYHISGRLMIRMDDGTEFECRPGDVSLLPSGHDGWVVGDEPVVVVDFQGMLGYAKLQHEIDERKRAYQALHDSELRYHLVAEQTGHLLYDHDIASGKIRWAGPTKEVTGYTADEFSNVDIKQWEQLVHPDDRPVAITEQARAQAELGKFLVEYRLRRADGSYVYSRTKAPASAMRRERLRVCSAP